MKKILITAAALTALTSNVYASKARILSLGESVGDVYYSKDSRRIFTNAAQIHNYNNQMMVEWGDVGASGLLDTDASPKAMGGFLTNCGSMICGAYLGNESTVGAALRIIGTDISTTGGAALKTVDNRIDLFIGGEAAVKWGASLIHSTSEDKDVDGDKATSDSLAAKFGIVTDKWEAYANVGLGNEAKTDNGNASFTTDQKFEGKLGVQVGGSYNFSESRNVYFTIKKLDWEETNDTRRDDGGYIRYILGYGRELKMSQDTNAFVRLSYDSLSIELENKTSETANKAELKNRLLPVVIGFETKTNSWLTLRGSVSHNLMGTAEAKNLNDYLTFGGNLHTAIAADYYAVTGTGFLDGKTTIANSTTVNAGATLEFGKLQVDGFIGTTGGNRGTGDNDTKNGVLSTDNLLTRVGMTYKF